MTRLALRRGAQGLVTILAVIVLSFTLVNLAPGDLVDVLAAEGQASNPEEMARLRRLYGLDVPATQRLLNYVVGAAQIDLGFSFRHGRPVAAIVAERLPASLLLMASALMVAAALGVAAGVFAARRVRSLPDAAVSAIAVLFFATPSFWLSLMLMLVFSVKLGLTPIAGMATIGAPAAGAIAHALDVMRHLALPAVSLGLFYAAIYARVMRASMLQVLDLDYVRTARAKGASEGRIVWRHAFWNAVLPILTLLGIQLGHVFAGAVVVEAIFSWPGLGSLLVEAVEARNHQVVMGVLIMSAIVVVATNLLVDALYATLDPRVRVR
ncbi:MAG: ABC transporter permease [Alphaproteobacteria bacterium]|nr:ABC transporter permease [Alphaproteobacteria bacterium]